MKNERLKWGEAMVNEYIVEAFIEIPKGTVNKYEYDEERGAFRLDRVLYSPVHYPADYGFVPDTLAEDGDPLDILVLISAPTFPGCRVPARIIGGLAMSDDKGMDQKLLSVASVDPRFDGIGQLSDLPAHMLREIEYFFSIYKELEGKTSLVSGWMERAEAMEVLEAAYRKRQRGT
ncbi:MAG TPA: inorganic diphosphatase [Bacillota bacterium]|nr:inorganic diphosphatase [Bacillota bacterium]